MLPISIAMIDTGLGARLGDIAVTSLLPYGGLVLVAGLFVLTMLTTQILGGQVTSLVIGPLALSAAIQAGINPQAMAVAVAIACSTSFLLPTAHPVNVLMMAPGGYEARDFLRSGVGMTIVTFIVLMIAMAVIWRV
jgi:di/tricarboxylate transporter